MRVGISAIEISAHFTGANFEDVSPDAARSTARCQSKVALRPPEGHQCHPDSKSTDKAPEPDLLSTPPDSTPVAAGGR